MNSTAQILCLKCKSYFGSEITKGLCSVCFKINGKVDEEIKIEEKKEEIKIDEKKEEIKTVQIEEKKEEKLEIVQSTKPIQTNKSNCWKCQKKVGYLGFTCRCTYIFCGVHRHFMEHNCDFDYKTVERERLKKENPLVVAKKV